MEHIMKTLYEVLNLDLAQQYTKARKLGILYAKELYLTDELKKEVEAAIAEMNIPEDDDRYHWIQTLGRQSGADLLTLGKVQPENMLAMAGLGTDDFKEAVKVALKSQPAFAPVIDVTFTIFGFAIIYLLVIITSKLLLLQ